MAAEREARLARAVAHAPDTRSLFLELPPGEELVFTPGQFVSCLLPSDGERIIRPYSIASSPEHRTEIELLLNAVPGGVGSHHLLSLRPGDTVRFTGPWGTFTCAGPLTADSVFIAENTAIAPIRSMLLALARLPASAHRIELLYGTRLGVYRDELAALPGVSMHVVPPETLESEAGRRYIDADADRSRHFFICGVGALVTRLRDRLRAAGYARRAVQYEKW